MERALLNNLHLWLFDNLSDQPGINHFVTDRNTMGPEFTLSFSSIPDKEKVRMHRREIARAMGLQPDQLYFPSQVHKTKIVNVYPGISKEMLLDTDALITDQKGVCLAVMSADCVPILLFDKKNNAVAAIHSGWRGTVARILEKTLHEMKRRFGTEGPGVIAGIGPSVCQDSYEVGEEVISQVKDSFDDAGDLLISQSPNKAKLDLWKANRVQLLEFGVPESNIEVSNLCTVKNNEHFFSARKGDSGRFAAGIVLA